VLLVSVMALWPVQVRAGTGLPYYGAHFGFWDFLEDRGQFSEADGGFAFGPKAGAYFISQWIAVALDASATVGLVGEDYDEWFVNLPTVQIGGGTGFKAFMIYAGGAIQLLGLDGFDENVAVSLGNPYAFGGLQLGWAGFIVRGEFQIGHAFRLGDHSDYSFTNIAITVGYGPYYEFL